MRLGQRLVLKYIRTKFKLLSSISKRKAAAEAFRLFCTPQYRNRKKLPPVFESAERISFQLEGVIVNGYRWNHTGEARKKALILHGFESSVINFDRYIKPLMRKNYEVLAFDAPAHGRSTGRTITVPLYKNMIRFVHDHYGPVTSFIAHSFGGLCLCMALEEIRHDESYKIALIAPAVETRTAIDNFFKFLKLDAEVRKEFEQLIMGKGGHHPDWYSISRVAPSLKANVLFLQDRDDEMTPFKDVQPIIEKQLPNFQFLISEGLGHRRIYRENRSLKAVIEFL